jgi:hypothetical protein
MFFNSPWTCREKSLSNGGPIKNNFEKIAVGLVISLLQHMVSCCCLFRVHFVINGSLLCCNQQ